MKEQIISEKEINEEIAKKYLFDSYTGVDLLPGIPDKLTEQDAAFVLNVSIPTIERLCASNEIKLTKKSLKNYIFRQFTYLKPLDLPQKNAPNHPILPHISP